MWIFDPWYGVVRVKTDVLLRSIFNGDFTKNLHFTEISGMKTWIKFLIPGCKRNLDSWMQEKQHYEVGNQISFSLNWPEFNGLVEVKEDRGIYMRGMRLLLSPAFYHSSFVQVIILYSFNCPCCPPGNNCSLPGSSVHEISQARILEWVAISSSKGSSQPRDWILCNH